jgi:hypothetical protein
MTVVLVALALSAALAVVGAWLLLTGRREERAALALALRERPSRPLPGRYTRMRALSVHPEDEAMPKPATPAAVDIHAAGRARLEVALAHARARLAQEAEPAEG